MQALAPKAQKNLLNRWMYAFKIKSWPKLLVPYFLGHAVGAATVQRLDWVALLESLLSITGGLIYIVLLNDWGDRRVDAIKREMFPDGCSPKTIPDGFLPARHLLVGGWLALSIAFGSFVWAGLRVTSLLNIVLYALLMSFVFIAYTLPPFKLNYRGGGELLEMLGVGLILPWSMAFLQTGELWPPFLVALLPYTLPMALSSAVASGLSDEESDRAGGKRTFVTIWGNRAARRFIAGLVISAMLVLPLAALLSGSILPVWAIIAAEVAMMVNFYNMQQLSPNAVTNAFGYQGLYKKYLHRAIWWGSLVVSAGLLWEHLVQ